MKFGVGIPTCTAGMMYPPPFASAEEVVRVALEAEQLGYYEVAGNDHLSTQRYVREAFSHPPDFFEPLITLSYIAAQTSVLRLMTGVIVLPSRQPVVLAKQVATLDQLSGGRLILGVGLGAYREEFEAAMPDLSSAPRASLLREGIDALRVLFTERRASYVGRYHRFRDVEMYPKPQQNPLPIYSSANSDGAIRRAALQCEGWLPAGINPARLREGRQKLRTIAAAAGRDPDQIVIAPQLTVCLGRTTEEARDRFEHSQLYHHLLSLARSTMRDIPASTHIE
ncbi:MAG: TIGR03619 family F420-dependent LLM class oxidoreductase, partial [Candidatus Dormiibacterota bacterium]